MSGAYQFTRRTHIGSYTMNDISKWDIHHASHASHCEAFSDIIEACNKGTTLMLTSLHCYCCKELFHIIYFHCSLGHWHSDASTLHDPGEMEATSTALQFCSCFCPPSTTEMQLPMPLHVLISIKLLHWSCTIANWIIWHITIVNNINITPMQYHLAVVDEFL